MALAWSCWTLLLLSPIQAAPHAFNHDHRVWPSPAPAEEPVCSGGDGCCTALRAMGWHCNEGEGDCDQDAECAPGLRCGSGNCNGFSFQPTDDCCYDPHREGGRGGGLHVHSHEDRRCDGGDSCCSGGRQCSLGEGDCDSDRDCGLGLVCGTDNCRGPGFDSTDDCCRRWCDGGDSCCTRANQCSLGEGDCDNDSDCHLGLVCGVDNCRGPGFDSTDDCCRQRCDGGDSCCSAWNQCKEGEGDCDGDSDCAPGLRCGKDNCRGRGFDSTDDCCERF